MLRRLLAIPTAILGVLLSHELTYSLLTTSDAAKHDLLDATGHSWRDSYPMILTFTILGLIISTYSEQKNRVKKISLGRIFLLQEAAFLAIEFGERALAHEKIFPALSILLLGTLLQLPAVLVIKFLLKYVVEPVIRFLSKRVIKSQEEKDRLVICYSYCNPFVKRIFSYSQQPRSPTINI